MRLRIILSLLVTVCGHFSVGALTVKDLPGAGGTLKNGIIYEVNKSRTLSAAGKNALCVEPNAKTVLYIPKDVTLTCNGANSSSYDVSGKAGILLPVGASLFIVGGGRLDVTGGNAGSGEDGKDGGGGHAYGDGIVCGNGGRGGCGGAGSGAGIGTDGGLGGSGGDAGPGDKFQFADNPGSRIFTQFEADGMAGKDGGGVVDCGKVYILGGVSVYAKGGRAGVGGNGGVAPECGGQKSVYTAYPKSHYQWFASGDGGGGGGGGGGYAGSAIGGGGSGGGGGGGGGGGKIAYNPGTYSSGLPVLAFHHGYGGDGGHGVEDGDKGGRSKTKPQDAQVSTGIGGTGGIGGACAENGKGGDVYVMSTATL